MAATALLSCTALGGYEDREVNHAESQRSGAGMKMDYFGLPQTWREAISQSDLVAVIKLRGKIDREVGEGQLPKTRFEADVLEVIGGRRAAAAGREIAVTRIGGFRRGVGAPKLIEQIGFPAWAVGRTSLVFLGWSDRDESYVLHFGPDGSFELDPATNKVQTFGRGPLAGSKKGRPFADILTELRAVAR